MDLLDDFLLRLRIVLLLTVENEEVVEVFRTLKKCRHQKVEERPEFFKIVLQRCASQKNSVPSVELPQILREDALIVLNSLSFVKDKVLVLDVHELTLFYYACLEGCKQDIKLSLTQFLLLDIPLGS